MKAPSEPTLRARQANRRRRVVDAARVLPFAGLFLFLLPVFWGGSDAGPVRTATGGLYLFGVWLGLIIASALLSRRLRRIVTEEAGAAE